MKKTRTILISIILIIVLIVIVAIINRKCESDRAIECLRERMFRKENIITKLDSLKKKYYLRVSKNERSQTFAVSGKLKKNEIKRSEPALNSDNHEIETSFSFSNPYFTIGYGEANKGDLHPPEWHWIYTVDKDNYRNDAEEIDYIVIKTANNRYTREKDWAFYFKEYVYDRWAWFDAHVFLDYNDIKMLKDIFSSGYKADLVIHARYGNGMYFQELEFDKGNERTINAYEEIKNYLRVNFVR